MESIQAKITNPQENGKNYSPDKELSAAWSVVGTINGKLREIVCCRTYSGRSRSAMTVYASVWAWGSGIYAAGHGHAGGYGYDKTAAAIDSAIRCAGIELSHEVCGDSDIVDALESIARALGATGPLVTVKHS